MDKIGIITYHNYCNYGTMLQALALQKSVENMGFYSEIIDFKQNNILTKSKLLKLRLKRSGIYLKQLKKYYLLKKTQKFFDEKNELFNEFYKSELNVGNKKYYSTQELIEEPPVYDAYVVGSDQTWNPYVAGRPEAFYLPFVDNDNIKGSYGPSLAINNLNNEQKEFLVKRLQKFSFISCREKTGTELLKKLIEKPITTVLDPTLLLDKEEWNLFCDNKQYDSPYILTYFLGENKLHREIVEELAKRLSMNIIAIPITYLELGNKNIEKVFAGPREFLNLIRNASLICTDSFHGTMFSINFEKNFYSFCKMQNNDQKSENSRLQDSLEEFGLADRLISNIPDKIENIDYKEVKKILNKRRKESKDYLFNMLIEMTRRK
ncbi:polysaccharide pyruvyl transferase family protein [Clostridium perfringens]|uniref:polysaccharide pyruvyl transferase family protein n=1 Tax=Clostridium perfringens TaxID=1502 RepID=UPI002861B03F|nr:polysaccharide pyruvyl transferase family protein [Clostridium perfringens]ELC8426483.1 polysaccharide pyruvyl transferase family protein [Clostridium perfringens]